MFRRCLFLGLWVLALMWQLGDPGQLHAQHSRGGLRQGVRPMFNPRFQGGLMPGSRPTPRFDPPFRGRMFNRRFDPRFRSDLFDRRFDRFEDRFENRSFFRHNHLLNRFGFDPFLRNGFGFDLFLASQFGVNPFLVAGTFGSVSPGLAALFAGGATGLFGDSTVASSGEAGSSADEARALLTAEQARGARLANRRKLFDEYLYERGKTPTVEDDRQRQNREQLQRSLHNPPVTEILSGMALNNILRELRKQLGNGDMTEPVRLPLDEAQLRHINVTRVHGNIALLKNDGRLSWPISLLESTFREEREQLASEALEAVRQGKTTKPVDAELLRHMKAHVDALHQQVRKQAGKWSPSEYIEANTFLDNLDEALVALRQPDVASHFNGTYALTATSVPELVKQMNQHGLEFARAVPGDEAAYVQLHQALAASASASATRLPAR